jgi:hypothetical protein
MSLIYQAETVAGQSTRSGLYIGGKDDAKDLDKLKRLNVKYILNVTPNKQANLQVRTLLLQAIMSMLLHTDVFCSSSYFLPCPSGWRCQLLC